MSDTRLDQKTADMLISKIADRDMSALETLYNAMYREIYGYLFSMLGGDVQGAEDLAQDTFIRVYKYARKFAAEGHGRSWVYRIAGRLALNRLHQNRTVPLELSEDLADNADMEDRIIDKQTVAAAMEALSPEERQIVSLHAVSGFTLQEIAEVLCQPLGTIKWRHAEALKKLRKYLNDVH